MKRKFTIVNSVLNSAFYFFIFLSFISCEKEETTPSSPSWPPIYSIAPDLGDYTSRKSEENSDLMNAGNWNKANIQAYQYNFLEYERYYRFILPFLNMENLQLSYNKEQNTWLAGSFTQQHPYFAPSARLDSITYKCMKKNNSYEWEIYIGTWNGASYLMIEGVSDLKNTSGSWVVHQWPEINDNETFNPDTLFYVNWFESGVENHPNLTLKSPAYDYEFSYAASPSGKWDRELITDNNFELYWNSLDKSGSARSEFMFGDNSLHCWDEGLINIMCEN